VELRNCLIHELELENDREPSKRRSYFLSLVFITRSFKYGVLV